ncbi:MAG: hypothetical protein PHV34_17355 [Verrucomicrobiae bacterium]|nr:hypothetical protein [Verrucomicrobiae bacterium]
MTFVAKLESWIDRRLNPVMFKEYVLLMRSKTLLGLYCATALIPFILTSFILPLSDPGEHNTFPLGMAIWSFSLGTFLVIGCSGLATMAMRSIIIERDPSTGDLLACSPLDPRRLIWGKWQANMLFALFGFAAFLPFAAASYLMGGMDLFFILFSLLAAMMIFGLWTSVGLYSALVGKTGLAQSVRMSLLGAGGGISGLLLSFLLSRLSAAYMQGTLTGSKSGNTLAVLALIAGASLVLWFTVVYFTTHSAAARIMLPALNPAGIRRQAAFVCILGATLCAAVVMAIHFSPVTATCLMPLFIIAKLLFLWETALDAATPARITRSMALKWKSLLLLPGHVCSYMALVTGLFFIDTASLLLALAADMASGGSSSLLNNEPPSILFIIQSEFSLYLLLGCLVTSIVRRMAPKTKPSTVPVFLIAAGSILSTFYLIVLQKNSMPQFHLPLLINPVWWTYFIGSPATIMEGFLCSLPLWGFPLGHFLFQIRQFRKIRRKVAQLRQPDHPTATLDV